MDPDLSYEHSPNRPPFVKEGMRFFKNGCYGGWISLLEIVGARNGEGVSFITEGIGNF